MAISNAEIAFDAFFEEQSARFGTPYPIQQYGSNRNWPVFLQLALICSARGWDPADYVHKTFGARNKTAGSLLVGDLIKPAMLAAYNPKSGVASSKEEYVSCINMLIQLESDGSDEKALLLSPLSPFPAWFRVFYPEQIDMEIVNAWSDIAKQEMSKAPGLVEFLKGLDGGKWEKIRKVLWFFDSPNGGNQ